MARNAFRSSVKLAVIGGSGFYHMPGLSEVEEMDIDTPYGKPSEAVRVGIMEGERVAFLPRHGLGHRLLPSEVPYRANIHALKLLGVEFIIAVSAVGSLREDIEPLHIVVPSQVIDRTRSRPSTFFGEGLVAHIGFDQPFCPHLSGKLGQATSEAGATVHRGGTLVVMEGPAFSSRAESELYRSWAADIIGMTALPEAKLAREAEICYAMLACVTDYDCWHDEHASVTVEMILANLQKNTELSQRIIRLAGGALPARRDCPCANALRNALITPLDLVPPATLERLGPLLHRYVIPGPEEK